MSDPWWPGSDDPDPSTWLDRPAFTVKRQRGGIVEGGDYVRGSTVEELPQTALRYPVSTSAESLIPGKGILYIRPFDYDTIEINWNIPPDAIDFWNEVVIVRSGFGHPSSLHDGQIVFRQLKTELFPGGYPLTAEGTPITATEVVYDPRDPRTSAGPGLPGGRWYYYSLFFRIKRAWVRSIVANTLLPRNHGHADHLWNAVPPYYRWIDEQQLGALGEGDLRKFLRIFGYELDLEREYVESLQQLYNMDFCPGPLLRRLGENYGVPYESGIGDIRYRALMARIGYLYRQRGTQSCLRQVIEAVSKSQCDITTSGNIMLLADDSDFFQGTGNWAGVHSSTPAAKILRTVADPNPTYTVVPAANIYLANDLNYSQPTGGVTEPPPGAGRGAMRFWTPSANATTDVILACGDGVAYDRTKTPVESRTIIPRYAGIPVEPENVYGFSIWVKAPDTNILFDPVLVWFDKVGNHSSLTGFSARGGPTSAASVTKWHQISVTGTSPKAVVATGSGLSKIKATPDPANGLIWTFTALEYIEGSQTGYDWTFASGTPATKTADTEVTVTFTAATPGTPGHSVVLTSPTGSYTIKVPAIAAPPAAAAYCCPMIYIDNRPTAVGSYSPLVFFGGAYFSYLGSGKTISIEGPDRYLRMGVEDRFIGLPRESPPYSGYLVGEPP